VSHLATVHAVDNISFSVRVPKGGGGALEPWSPEIFVVKSGALSLSQLGAPTKM